MKDSSHWYRLDGSACFELPNVSKGGMRPVRITDARKLGLLPSVTTVQQVLAKPALDEWKQKQVAGAAYDHPARPGENREAFMARVIEQAFQPVEDAADLGTAIHKALECHFQKQSYDSEMEVYVKAVDEWAKGEEIEWLHHELRLVNKSHGYAGTTDAAIKCKRGRGILDFKSRKTSPDFPVSPYEGQPMQIAAYLVAHLGTIPDDACGVNVYISTTEPGRVEACWYDSGQLWQEWEAFNHCLALWRHVKKYDPRTAVLVAA